MKIDSHQHFWHYHPERENWIPDSMAVIRKNFLPKDIKPLLKENHIDGCIAVQANESEGESEFLLDLAVHNPFVKGVVGWIDLSAENAGERLSYFAQNPLFKGVRDMLQSKTSKYILSRGFQEGISKLDKFNLSYDLLVQENQLPATIELVKNFPKQRFVLDHMAKPQISQGVSPNWSRDIKELGKLENVYCKVSGLTTETKNFQWDLKEFSPFLDTVSNAFGEDRLMFGSDWPVCLAAGKYEDTLDIARQLFHTRDELISEKILGKNAAAFYNL